MINSFRIYILQNYIASKLFNINNLLPKNAGGREVTSRRNRDLDGIEVHNSSTRDSRTAEWVRGSASAPNCKAKAAAHQPSSPHPSTGVRLIAGSG